MEQSFKRVTNYYQHIYGLSTDYQKEIEYSYTVQQVASFNLDIGTMTVHKLQVSLGNIYIIVYFQDF